MTTRQKVRKAFWGMFLGVLLFGAGAAVAAYLLSISGVGTISTYAAPDVVFESAAAQNVVDATCVVTKLSGNSWDIVMSDSKAGTGTCTARISFRNNGNVPAYLHQATYTAPAGVTVAPAAGQTLPADGSLKGYSIVITNTAFPVGAPGDMTFSLVIDDIP